MKVTTILLAVLFLSAYSCTRVPHQPPPVTYDATYKYPKDIVYQAAINALPRVGLMVKSENKETGVITADGTFGKEEAKKMTNFKPSRLFVAMSILVTPLSSEITAIKIRTAMSGKRTPVFNTIAYGIIGWLASEKNPELTSNGTLEANYKSEVKSIVMTQTSR